MADVTIHKNDRGTLYFGTTVGTTTRELKLPRGTTSWTLDNATGATIYAGSTKGRCSAQVSTGSQTESYDGATVTVYFSATEETSGDGDSDITLTVSTSQ